MSQEAIIEMNQRDWDSLQYEGYQGYRLCSGSCGRVVHCRGRSYEKQLCHDEFLRKGVK